MHVNNFQSTGNIDFTITKYVVFNDLFRVHMYVGLRVCMCMCMYASMDVCMYIC